MSSPLWGGSFRDRESRVVLDDGRVLRALSAEALDAWRMLSATRFAGEFAAAGRLVATREADAAALPDILGGRQVAVLEHDRLPFVSYPYEWPFSMLRDAALLQLDVLLAALEEGMTLKDATPYNVQWRGSRPVFIDVGSFEALREGEPWVGYRQFCTLFLNPLLLQSLLGVAYQPWLRGSREGIAPDELRRLLPLRRRLRRGVPAHVVLHARLERRYADAEGDARGTLKAAGFTTELIKANVRKLRRIVGRLEWAPAVSTWSAYRTTCSYSDADRAAKERFVRRHAGRRRSRLVADLGCNDGSFSRLVAPDADLVVAIDGDQLAVDRLYRSLREEGRTDVLPLVADLADPPPDLGWRGLEREALERRLRPDLVLALALVHHLSIAGHVPLPEVVAWLSSFGCPVVVELPLRHDPMVQRLLSRKGPAGHPDYDREPFERALAEAFVVEEAEALPSGARVLYAVRPRRAAR